MTKKDFREKLDHCVTMEDYTALASDPDVIGFLEQDAKHNNPLKDNNIFLMGKTDKQKKRNRAKIVTFNLPQGITCPEKTAICKAHCYEISAENMLKGEGQDSLILYSRKKNLIRSMSEQFVPDMVSRILRTKPGDKPYIVRIHSSGDFYSAEYLRKWMEISARIQHEVKSNKKHVGKKFRFVGYTKSAYILRDVIADQEKLNDLYTSIFGVGKKSYTFSDFKLHVIGSIMDDTPPDKIAIFSDLKLPCYFVEENPDAGQTDCLKKPCATCLRCYPMKKDVHTILRT